MKAINSGVVDAEIVTPGKIVLPSLTDGWRFNFRKHAKKTGFEKYVLVCKETPETIEGCLIFEMREKIEPYMAYIEIAPHNKGENRKFDKVAGCLIAFACRLSFIHGKEDYKGWLAFDVLEKDKKDEIRLMALYCQKYGALKFGQSTMLISPAAGEVLIRQFLNCIYENE